MDENIIALSDLVSRTNILAKMGKGYGTQRDLFAALGYELAPTFDSYWWRYKRTSMGKRIIQAFPKACWQREPQIQEDQESEQTAFEEAWSVFMDEHKVIQTLRRLDILTGIGWYGILYLGFSGAQLDMPLEVGEKFLYMRPFTSNTAEVGDLVREKSDPRYGLPLNYKIQMAGQTGSDTMITVVHHTRVLHVAEDIEEGEVLGTPRLEACLNDLQSLDYVVGGSGEMFWRGAFPGVGFLAKDGFSFPTEGVEKTKMEDEMAEYIHGLKRYMKLKGVDIHDFATQATSPEAHYNTLVSSISAATNIPKRILTGSERGELASTQDRDNWADAVSERQRNYCEPTLLRPLLDRLIDQKVLPTPVAGQYAVSWPPIQDPSSQETSLVAKSVAEALNTYASGAAETVMPLAIYLKRYLNFTVEEVEEVEEALASQQAEMEEEASTEAEIEARRREEEHQRSLEIVGVKKSGVVGEDTDA